MRLRSICNLIAVVLLISLVSSAPVWAIAGEEAKKALCEAGWSPEIAEKIVARAINSDGRVVAVFDHDNTLICGDITEGNGKSQPGFMHSMLLRLHGQKKVPVPVGGLYESEPWEFYHTWARSKPQEAYPWICTLLAGRQVEDVHREAEVYYEKYLKPAIFPEMKALIEVLQILGVDVYIVSASAHEVVTVSAAFFGVPADRVHGIRLQVINGYIQPKVINPISFAAGKTWYIKNFAGEFKTGNIMVFGDSYRTDGHMLRFAAAQGGLALLVNPAADIEETLNQRGILHYHLPSKASLDR
ncbi:MAG: haloacid dehalogenase-like hydrolase [Candidatus Riflebacteria bacterium]